LAQLALALSEVEGLEAGNLDEAREYAEIAREYAEIAREHAETARERAECDGPGHRYEVAFQLAERLLGEIEGRA
jgi:hypothetical protein